MLKFLHMADLHLGISYETLPDRIAAECRDAQLSVFTQMVRTAYDRKVDAILIAGDLFDSPTPPTAVFRQAMQIISSAHCPVFLSPGNHDYICADSVYLREQLPENLHVFTNTVFEPYVLNPECIVWGAAFDGMTASIPLHAPLAPALQNICLIHTDLRTESKYNHYEEAEIADSGFQYLAAGHNHAGSVLKRAGKTWYCRPGSLMATKTSEVGTKGCFYVELDDEPRIEPLIGNGIEFQEYTIDLSPVPSDVGLQKLLVDRIPKHHDQIAATFRFVGERVYEPNFAALSRALEQIFFYCTISDETKVKKPLWRYLQSGDLRGGVSRNFRDRIEMARDEDEKADFLLAFRYALAAFDDDPPPNA